MSKNLHDAASGAVLAPSIGDGHPAEGAVESDQILGDERVHDDDEQEGHDERDEQVEHVDHPDEGGVVFVRCAHELAFDAKDARDEERVRVADQSQHRQRRDDRLGARYRAHGRPLQRVLDGDEALHRERNRQPNRQARKYVGAVHDRLAPALAHKQVDTCNQFTLFILFFFSFFF